MKARLLALPAVLAVLAAPAPAAAVPPQPIAEGPDAASLPRFSGRPATPRPVAVPDPPRHPFMAPNGRSNLHVDAYQSDVHQGPGPLGRETEKRSTFLEGVCASVTFDSRGRIVTVCVGLEGPKLLLLEPRTLETLAAFPLPPRMPGGGNLFTDFAGGGYFYLDHRDRAVIPTTTRHVLVVRQTGGGSGFELERDYDLTAAVLPGDKIISALPDWHGRLWFASTSGVVGTVDPASGAVRPRPLGEGIANSFAVEDTGAVYIVTDKALYRLEAGATGVPEVAWREAYENSGVQKPGQASAGSGTTPTLMGDGLVAITDNADPMNVLVYRRGRGVTGPRRICRQPVFEKGASATDQSLIGTGRSLVVENNHGYSGPAATQQGGTTVSGARARRPRPGRRLPLRLALERASALGRPEALGRQRARLHVHEGPPAAGPDRRRLVPHGARLRDRPHGLQAPRRRGLRPQQQLRAGHARPRRHRLRRRARRPHLAARQAATAGSAGARRRVRRPQGAAEAAPARAAARAPPRAGARDGRRDPARPAGRLRPARAARGARPAAAVPASRARRSAARAAAGADPVARRAAGGADQAGAAGAVALNG